MAYNLLTIEDAHGVEASASVQARKRDPDQGAEHIISSFIVSLIIKRDQKPNIHVYILKI